MAWQGTGNGCEENRSDHLSPGNLADPKSETVSAKKLYAIKHTIMTLDEQVSPMTASLVQAYALETWPGNKLATAH